MRSAELDIAERLEERAVAGRTSVLTPETAATCARALRMAATSPMHDDMLRALCRRFREGQCENIAASGCITCVGQASAAINVLRGQ